MHLDIRCPACGHQGIEYNTATTDIPYFGDCMETLVRCDACGFRHTDVQVLGQKEAMRHHVFVEAEKDLEARIVRSNSGTIRIPELGVAIEPGPMSESFVTNVEGVLVRVLRILGQLSRDGDDEQRDKAVEMIERIERIRNGGEPITVVIEDPFGNSGIAHPKASAEALSEQEAATLKTGMTVVDMDELDPEAAKAMGVPLPERPEGQGDDASDVDDLLRP